MKTVSRVICGAALLCGVASIPVSAIAQPAGDLTPGVGSTVVGHEAKANGTPNTGPYGTGESTVTPGQNAINGQTKKQDLAAPGQNQSNATSPSRMPADQDAPRRN